MDDSLIEKVLKEHETRIVLLSNKVKWMEKELKMLNELTRKTSVKVSNLKCSDIRKMV